MKTISIKTNAVLFLHCFVLQVKLKGIYTLTGTTAAGPSAGMGTIFQWIPESNTYIKKADLSSPWGGWKKLGSKFYGMKAVAGN